MSDENLVLSEEAARNAAKTASVILKNIDQKLEEDLKSEEREKLISDKDFYTRLSDNLMDLIVLYKNLDSFEKSLSSDPDNYDIQMDISEVKENIETLNSLIVSEYKKRHKLT